MSENTIYDAWRHREVSGLVPQIWRFGPEVGYQLSQKLDRTVEIIGESSFGLWESEITGFCYRIRKDRSPTRFDVFPSVQKYDRDLLLKFTLHIQFGVTGGVNVPEN